jgi:DNA-binding MarR family transcriptional regulator
MDPCVLRTVDNIVRMPYYNSMKDFSEEAFQILNALTAINEKYNQIDKHPLSFGAGVKVYPSQIRTIVMIGNHQGINITELAKRLEIAKASASELVSKLVETGLIRKTRDAGNNKDVLLNTTPECKEILELIDRRHAQMFLDFKSILGEQPQANYEVVVRVLRKVEFYLDKFIKES